MLLLFDCAKYALILILVTSGILLYLMISEDSKNNLWQRERLVARKIIGVIYALIGLFLGVLPIVLGLWGYYSLTPDSGLGFVIVYIFTVVGIFFSFCLIPAVLLLKPHPKEKNKPVPK